MKGMSRGKRRSSRRLLGSMTWGSAFHIKCATWRFASCVKCLPSKKTYSFGLTHTFLAAQPVPFRGPVPQQAAVPVPKTAPRWNIGPGNRAWNVGMMIVLIRRTYCKCQARKLCSGLSWKNRRTSTGNPPDLVPVSLWASTGSCYVMQPFLKANSYSLSRFLTLV